MSEPMLTEDWDQYERRTAEERSHRLTVAGIVVALLALVAALGVYVK